MLVLVMMACQVPVGGDRHDLVGDRVAAVVTTPSGDGVTARAALVVDGHLWSDTAVDLGWSWVDSDDPHAVAALDADSPRDASGPAATLPAPPGRARLALVATFPSGYVEHAFVDVSTPAVSGPALVAVDASGDVDRGDTITLTARFDPTPDAEPMVRWMSLDGVGTFTEATRASADWQAAEVELDDGEVVGSTPVRAGLVTVLALAIDGAGGNAFLARELDVGGASVGGWTPADRFLPAAAALPSGLVRATLVADDDAPAGVTFVGAAPAGTLPDVDPYGTETLCPGVSGPFDPAWLLDGRCLRSDVVGASVVVEVR